MERKVKQTICMFLLLLVNCGCNAPTSFEKEVVDKWWRLGQDDVACYGDTRLIYKMTPDSLSITIIELDVKEIKCGNILSAGCFTPPTLIVVLKSSPYVLRHETAHAILYHIGHPCWRTLGHSLNDGCNPCG